MADGLTVESVRKAVAFLKDAVLPPEWADWPAIAKAVVRDEMKLGEVGRLVTFYQNTIAAIVQAAVNAEAYAKSLAERLEREHPACAI